MDATGPGAAIERRAHAPAPQVMLLTVWRDEQSGWHARVVLHDTRSHEFTSPFELAQFLAQAPRSLDRPGSGTTGLR